jgi:transposase-like protein
MKIKQIYDKMRFDFSAILECEHCQSEQIITTGYDDSYYHQRVIPSINCKKCGKNRNGETGENHHGTKSV